MRLVRLIASWVSKKMSADEQPTKTSCVTIITCARAHRYPLLPRWLTPLAIDNRLNKTLSIKRQLASHVGTTNSWLLHQCHFDHQHAADDTKKTWTQSENQGRLGEQKLQLAKKKPYSARCLFNYPAKSPASYSESYGEARCPHPRPSFSGQNNTFTPNTAPYHPKLTCTQCTASYLHAHLGEFWRETNKTGKKLTPTAFSTVTSAAISSTAHYVVRKSGEYRDISRTRTSFNETLL